MAVGPRVEYRVTTEELNTDKLIQGTCLLVQIYYFVYIIIVDNVFLSRTWEIVHKAGLCCEDPLGSGLTEDGNVALRPLAQSCQTAAKTLCCLVCFLIRQPVIVPKNNLQKQVEFYRMNEN